MRISDMDERNMGLPSARPAKRIMDDSMRKSRRRLRGAQLLKFFRRLRPVLVEQERQRAIRQELAASLAVRTVVRLVVGVTDALDPSTARWARLVEFSMHRHLRTKCGDVLGETIARLLPQSFDPV